MFERDQASEHEAPRAEAKEEVEDAGAQARATQLAHQDISRVARAGVAEAAQPLPHADAIQRSFGSHDISGIRTSVGGAAAGASGALGAEAFATGEQVAFAGPPDLRTAAHEAAHVVQNRRGGGEKTELTTPGDAHETHADAVADAVVRGESATALLASAPAGTGAVARRPSAVNAPADAKAAMAELELQLDNGITNPGRIQMLVAMISWADQANVRDHHFEKIKQACTAAQVITIARTIGMTPAGIVQAALGKRATPAELGPALRGLGSDDVQELANDPDVLSKLKAAVPGRAALHIPVLRSIYDFSEHGDVMRWIVETTPPLELWKSSLNSTTAKKEIADTFDREKLWGWVSQLTPSALTAWDAQALREYAGLSSTAKPELEAVAAAVPQKQIELDEAKRGKQNKEGAADLAALLATTSPTADAVLEAAVRAASAGRKIASDDKARTRAIEILTLDQLSAFTELLGFSSTQRVDWLLAAPGIDAKNLANVFLDDVSHDDLARLFASDTRVKRMKKVFGDVSPLSIAPSTTTLQRHALKSTVLREWLLGKASPLEIFEFVTLGQNGDAVAEACKAVAKDHGYGWVYALTNVEERSVDIRRLALALPDRAAAAHLRKFGIKDWPLTTGIEDKGSPMAADVYETADKQLADAVTDGRGADVAKEAAELDDAQRARITTDRALVQKAIGASAAGANMGHDAVRTARELDGNLADTLRAIEPEIAHVDKASFRTYARERPAAEQIEVAADRHLMALAKKLLRVSPFNTLPALAEENGLARALAANTELLVWISETTNAVEALEHLGEPKVASAAAHALEVHGTQLIRGLPAAALLTPTQKMKLMRIGADATKSKLHEAVADRLTAETDEKRGVESADMVNGSEKLAERIDHWRATKQGSNADIQAACNARPHDEVIALLADSQNGERIDFLHHALRVSPLTVFPWLAGKPPAELYRNRQMVEWLLDTEEPVSVLRAIANVPIAITHVALGIDIRRPIPDRWLINLPSGHGLSDLDEAALHKIYAKIADLDRAKWVFATRFGHLPEGEWSRESLDKLWTVLARLPDRHVEANLKFGGLASNVDGEKNPSGGKYSPGTGTVHIDQKEGEGIETRYDKRKWQTKSALAKELGVPEEEIDRRVGADLVEKSVIKGVEMFRIKMVGSKEAFTHTALHETGHAVDAMLGSSTDLVFGLAGWKTYGGAEFDTWASDMGAWNGASVAGEDRTDIKHLFEQRLQSSSAIHGPGFDFAAMVPKTHALKEGKNANARIVKEVNTSRNAFDYTRPFEANGRMFFMSYYYGRFMSYDAKLQSVLPTPYSGFAPQEFFAECYTEYYRDSANKGGNLPAWVKTWFDENVDRAGRGPK